MIDVEHGVDRDWDRLSVVVVSDREKHNTTSAGVVASINLIGRTRSRAVHNIASDTLIDIDGHSQVQCPTYTQEARVLLREVILRGNTSEVDGANSGEGHEMEIFVWNRF